MLDVNVVCMCRFLGYVQHKFPEIQDLSFSVFSAGNARSLIDAFANWLVDERKNSYGTVRFITHPFFIQPLPIWHTGIKLLKQSHLVPLIRNG